MQKDEMNIAFGPVPSRRLGRSLGINNIPPKSCSYSCLYCQVGATQGPVIEPREFYSPEAVYSAVTARLSKAGSMNEPVDYLTFVPDGEPTLDKNLGRAIEMLRPLNIPVAVITNASLLWRDDVRANLAQADWVSIKVDSVVEDTWQQVNRPHAGLRLSTVMDGIRQFAAQFRGELVSETMLLNQVNDSAAGIAAVADFLHEIRISKAYLAIPTRPTTMRGATAPDEDTVNHAYQVMAGRLPQVEYLIGYEGDAFTFTGDVEQDILSITAVHPMRESAVKELLDRAGTEWSLLQELLDQGRLRQVSYQGNRYYVRRFSKQAGKS
jgi:wyosine [tRNA(Phe)-imidazoG37] synthetase (radical SAM superfamily)